MHSLKTLLQLPCRWQCSRQIISSDGITLHLRGKRKQHNALNALSVAILFIVVAGWIQHLPCAGQTLWLVFSVRHWYCRNPACSRKIFAESLAPFAGSHQQSSLALQNLQRQLGLIAGGEAGKRAATAVGLRCSADTLLRRVINTPETRLSGALHVSINEWRWPSGPPLRYVNCQS
ncbi:transposase [Escherichia coli]|nr:transposase [Escherichia coli]CTU32236.1 transposase [Escherichia coli]CTV84796.1 transposase [Escherichia coli]CTW08097.1 transposase [Escherichia coli]CTW51283.1 transposase [Escherichia coli]